MTTVISLKVDAELEEEMSYQRLKNEVLEPAIAELLSCARMQLSHSSLPVGASVTITLAVSI